MFELKYSNQATKFLKKLDKISSRRIYDRIESLIAKPIEHDSKLVGGTKEKLFRVRVGDFRILYEVDHNNNIIGIVKIDKRDRAY